MSIDPTSIYTAVDEYFDDFSLAMILNAEQEMNAHVYSGIVAGVFWDGRSKYTSDYYWPKGEWCPTKDVSAWREDGHGGWYLEQR